MKPKPYLFPVGLLLTLLGLSLWNSHVMTARTDALRAQLLQADQLVQAEQWTAALRLLRESHSDWSSHQTYLHIVTAHDAMDDAEAMYRRLTAYAESQEASEFHTELADLRDQLRLLAEMEQCSIKNIL